MGMLILCQKVNAGWLMKSLDADVEGMISLRHRRV